MRISQTFLAPAAPWSLEPHDTGTEVTFVAEGELRGWMRVIAPLASRGIARQFASYHRNLCRNLAQAATV
jgi:hypothetical protein